MSDLEDDGEVVVSLDVVEPHHPGDVVRAVIGPGLPSKGTVRDCQRISRDRRTQLKDGQCMMCPIRCSGGFQTSGASRGLTGPFQGLSFYLEGPG